MLVSFLLTASALAGSVLVSETYDQECSVVLDGEEVPALALFGSWVETGSGIEGAEDGTFSWMVSGWSAYGYQQSIRPLTQGPVETWGWSLVVEDDPGEDLQVQTVTLSCSVGGVASVEDWDRLDLFASPMTLLAEDETGEAETLALDRLRVEGTVLSVSCEDVGWPDRTPLTLTLSWFGGAS